MKSFLKYVYVAKYTKWIFMVFCSIPLFYLNSIGQVTMKHGLIKETKSSNKNSTAMDNQNFTTTIVVDQSPEKVFDAVNNVRGWWSQSIEGETDKLNAEFNYHYKDVHRSTMRLIEVIPGKKIVWQVIKNYFNFTKDTTEWTGNKVIFEISQVGNNTQLQFTQVGLVPEYECYEICRDAWTNYVTKSLFDLITTGKGDPNPKESDFNDGLLKKHKK